MKNMRLEADNNISERAMKPVGFCRDKPVEAS
jgi:hypothetical protein